MSRLVFFALALSLGGMSYSQVPTSWRGPTGDGNYPESGLLKTWPGSGPEILWSYGELGQGHSSPIVSNGFVYVSGMSGNQGFLFKFDLNGKLIYRVGYGPEFSESYYGPRGTPVIVGDKVYLLSGLGKLVCFNEADGEVLWSKELFRDFDGSNTTWGVNETPVVDGSIIYATPGGKETM